MDRKNALDTLTVRNTADSEVFIDAGTLTTNHDSRVNLDTLLFAFHNAGVDFDGVPNLKGGHIGLELFGFDFLDCGH